LILFNAPKAHNKYTIFSFTCKLATLEFLQRHWSTEEKSMSTNRPTQKLSMGQTIQKFTLSAFVVLSFIAYAIHQRFSNPDSPINIRPSSPTVISQTVPAQAASGFVAQAPSAPAVPTTALSAPAQQAPTAAPIPATATPKHNGQYKDGTYTGPQIDAYYGYVEVQATIQNGQITTVQFLQYPSDRRTSQRINSIAMPWLQQEAIQAQSANVNLISGATLTSEGFIYSLDAALKSARY
jgi:uncharacterized protein with FMN-binding domain